MRSTGRFATWYPAVLVVVSAIFSAVAYSRLPAVVPTHWNIHGEVDRTGSKLIVTLFFPLMVLALWGLLRGLPKIDPRRANYARMQGTYDLVVNLVLTTIVVVHGIVLAATMGAPIATERLVPAVIGVMLIVLGNVLPRARPNWWFGVRTPWTMSNDRVWERTHRVAGYVVSVLGVLALGVAIAGIKVAAAALGIAAVVVSVGLIGYSYFAWRQETSR